MMIFVENWMLATVENLYADAGLLQVQFHENCPWYWILRVRLDFPESEPAIERHSFPHLMLDGIQPQPPVSDPSCFLDRDLCKDLSHSFATMFRPDVEAFHFTGEIFQRTKRDTTRISTVLVGQIKAAERWNILAGKRGTSSSKF